MKPLGAVLGRFGVGVGFGIALAFLLLPLLALVLHTTPGDLVAGLRSPVVLDAIRLSLITTLGTLLLTLAFERSCTLGLREVDLLRGSEPYKQRFAPGTRSVVRLRSAHGAAGHGVLALLLIQARAR